ncbi:phosphate signaling complex protein PhoU [Reyranella sp. CPCC 100927]|uniref:phosphate signaling complex protein PhoU n=1 Tax=Reyranella sp. CPCC 100927 TaxID=2599616 RepID=UPI0011B6449B|nr:phosphate signaling complex protein PhoU [Reyranella sp. CPCC 100927]TWS95698.1 phosphate signaling complex protein PhoU [Reyranella sp. CPCC 100927]
MPAEHLVKRFDDELEKLDASISEMGGLAESQLAMALAALRERNSETAEKVMKADNRVDELDRAVQNQVIRLLALRQPMANDLRLIVTSIKIASALERIADYAKNVAKRSLQIQTMTTPPLALNGVDRLGRLVQNLLKDVLDALSSKDDARARAVWTRDADVDDVYHSLVRELLTYMMEDARTISACTQLMFMAKNIERIGDHATNIAELLLFRWTGEEVVEERPRGTS